MEYIEFVNKMLNDACPTHVEVIDGRGHNHFSIELHCVIYNIVAMDVIEVDYDDHSQPQWVIVSVSVEQA